MRTRSRGFSAVLLAAVLVLLAVTGCTEPVEEAPGVFRIDGEQTIEVDGTAITFPEGAVPAGTRATVRAEEASGPVDPDLTAEVSGPLSMDLTDDAQPAQPLRVSIGVDASADELPAEGSVFLWLRSDDGEVDILPGKYDQAAGTVSAEVPHLSSFGFFRIDWGEFEDRILQAVGLQSPQPACDGEAQTVGATSYSVKSTDRMWACVETDDQDRLTMRSTANSPHSYLLRSSPRTPVTDLPSDEISSAQVLSGWLTQRIADPSGSGSADTVLAPGYDAVYTLGEEPSEFAVGYEQYPPGVLIAALMSAVDLLLNITGQGFVPLVSDVSAMTELLDKVQCLSALGEAADADSSITELVPAFLDCLPQFAEVMVGESLSRFSSALISVLVALPGALAAMVGGIVDQLTGNAEFTIALDVALDPGRSGSDFSQWQSGPGFIGPINAGDDARDLVDAGWISPSDDLMCDVWWRASERLEPAGFFIDFRDNDPDLLDGITVGEGSGYRYPTAEGIGIGSSTDELFATYDDLTQGAWGQEGEALAGWVRSDDEGSIAFQTGWGGWPGSFGDEVIGISVAPQTNADDFQPPFGGC